MNLALLITTDPAITPLADVVRTACAIGAAVLIGAAVALAYRTTRHTAQARAVTGLDAARDYALLLLGFALLAVSALFTELGRIGQPVSWRLPFNVAGIALGLVAVGRLLRRTRQAQRT